MTENKTYEIILASRGQGLVIKSWRSFRKNRLAVLAMIFLIFIHLMGFFAPWVAPYPYERIDLMNTLSAPGEKNLLGTDESGRDVASRLIYGARISLSVGLVAMVISFSGASDRLHSFQ